MFHLTCQVIIWFLLTCFNDAHRQLPKFESLVQFSPCLVSKWPVWIKPERRVVNVSLFKCDRTLLTRSLSVHFRWELAAMTTNSNISRPIFSSHGWSGQTPTPDLFQDSRRLSLNERETSLEMEWICFSHSSREHSHFWPRYPACDFLGHHGLSLMKRDLGCWFLWQKLTAVHFFFSLLS